MNANPRIEWLKRFPGLLNRLCGHPLLILSLVLAGEVRAGQTRSIELVDGSVVVGEILSAGNATYTVKTERLGVLTLHEADIVAIRSKDSVPRPARSADRLPSIQPESLASIGQKIVSNPQLLQSVNALKDDPDFQQILQDPDLMKAIEEGNLEVVKGHPKIQKLMTNPTVQGIFQQFGQ